MQAKFDSRKFREIEEIGEYNEFAEGGLWIKFKGEEKLFHCEQINRDDFTLIFNAFQESLTNDRNESGDDDRFEEYEIAEKHGLVK